MAALAALHFWPHPPSSVSRSPHPPPPPLTPLPQTSKKEPRHQRWRFDPGEVSKWTSFPTSGIFKGETVRSRNKGRGGIGGGGGVGGGGGSANEGGVRGGGSGRGIERGGGRGIRGGDGGGEENGEGGGVRGEEGAGVGAIEGDSVSNRGNLRNSNFLENGDKNRWRVKDLNGNFKEGLKDSFMEDLQEKSRGNLDKSFNVEERFRGEFESPDKRRQGLIDGRNRKGAPELRGGFLSSGNSTFSSEKRQMRFQVIDDK